MMITRYATEKLNIIKDKELKILNDSIHKDQGELKLKNITKDSYLKKMHVIDDNNELKVGVDAFIALWKKHQYLKYLAMIISFYPLKFIATIGYNIFAIIRFKRLYK